MKRIIFVNRFFFPDHSANSQLLVDLAFHLASTGREVHVVTSRQLYDDPRALLPRSEIVEGVHIHRLSTTQFGRSGLLGRSFDYMSFYTLLWCFLHRFAAAGDILVAETDPPLVSVLAMWAAKRHGAEFVNWLQDIYPEVAIELGIPFVQGPFGKALIRLRDRSLQAAAANIVVGQGMAKRLLLRGIDPQRVFVIPNWTDDAVIRPINQNDNPLRREWCLEHKFVVGYSGNLGRVHEFETVLAAAERLRSHPEIVFLFIGGGHRISELKQLIQARGLSDKFQFIPYQKRAQLKYSLSVPDAHWLSLKPELEGLMVPSKFFGIAAAGRLVIAITANEGEIARLVQQHGCGFVIEPGNVDELAKTIVSLSTNKRCLVELGHAARVMLDAHFTQQQALERWRHVLEAIG